MRPNVLNHKAQLVRSRPQTPVDRLFSVIRPARASALIGLSTEAVRKWNRRRSTGGGGGLIPSQYQALYLQVATTEGLGLTAADFIGEPWE